jgi:hypothetical protein
MVWFVDEMVWFVDVDLWSTILREVKRVSSKWMSGNKMAVAGEWNWSGWIVEAYPPQCLSASGKIKNDFLPKINVGWGWYLIGADAKNVIVLKFYQLGNGGFVKTRQLHKGGFGHIWSPLIGQLKATTFCTYLLLACGAISDSMQLKPCVEGGFLGRLGAGSGWVLFVP